ncbi:MAG: hypothetical protein HY960_01865, partial [Ignavibacteriae bacterium]|nr:hypothetical protein [Ignavibacteriota bacterium]
MKQVKQINMNIIKRTLFLIFFFTSIVFSATTSWKGTTSTSWNNSTNWTNGVPTSTLDVIIGDANFTGGNHPTLNVSGNCKSLIIGGANSATLTLSFNNKNLTVSGDITIQSNGTLLQSSKSTILLTGNWVNSGTFTASNNNAEVRFAGALQSLTGVTAFRKLTVNVGSTLTLHANISHTRTLSVSGTINPNESPTYTISGAGALTLQSGGKLLVKASTFVGNYNDGTKTFSSGSIVEYAASSTNQTVSNSFTYSTLQISGGMTKTLAGNLPSLSSATSTVGNIYVLSGTFDLSSFTANRGTTVVGGIFSVSNGAVVKIGGTNSFPQNYQTHSFGVTSTVEYSGGNQTVSNELYGNLTLSSSSGAVVKTMPTSSMSILGNLSSNVGSGTSVSYTAGEALSIGGSISIGTSTTFNASSYSHNISGNWTNNGTFTGNTSTVTLAGNSSTISGTGTNSFNHLIISGSNVTASSSTAINVAGNFSTSGAGTFLHTTGGSGLFTMSGTSKTISGSGISFSDLTISGTITTSSSYTVAGNLSVTNSLIASGGTTTLSGTSKTITNSGTLNLSVLSVTGTITTTSNFTLTSDLHVIGSLTATAGTATFAGVSGLSGTANLFNVVLNGTSLTLGTNSELGIAGSFTITSGTFDATSETPNTVNYNSSGAQSVIVASYYNLNVSNGGVKTPAGNLIIYGNLTIGAGTTLSGSSYTYTLYGHWNNGGTFSAGTSTVELVGGVDASIIGTTTFNILTVNKTSTLNILSVNNIVVSILNMTQGRLQTGNGYSITITNTRTGTGLIFGTVTRTHSFFTGVSYAFHSVNDLVTFNGGGTNPTSVTRTLELTSPVDMPVPELSINRTYTMTQTGGSGYTATVRFYYSEEDLNGNIESQLEAWHYDGASWSGIGKSAYDVTDNWLERDGLTDITNRWTLQSPLLGILDWNGSVSSAWEDPANWTVFSGIPSIPPTSTELVRIGFNAFTNNPTVNSAAQCRALRYGSAQGSVLSIQSGSLTTDGNSGEIAGTFTQDVTHTIEVNNNTLTCSGSMLLSNGTANRIINITLGSGTIYIQRKLDQLANASVTITGSGSIILAGDWNRTSGSFSAGTGTVTYNGSVDQLVATGITYNNLTFSKTGGIALFASSASVAGDLAISNNGKIQLNGDLDVDGDVTVGVGTILSSGSINLSVGGDWNLLGTFEPNLGSVIFDGTSDQSISSSSFNNLEIDKSSGTANLTGNITINSDLTVAAGSLELYSYNANRSVFGGTFTMGAGTTVRVGGANNFPSNFSTYTFNANSTSEYYGTVSQSVKDVTYGNLKFYNGTSNPKTLTGTTNVQGNLLINSGATFDGSSFALNLDGDWTNNGTFTPSSSIVTLQGTSKNLVGNTSFHELSVSGSYTGQNNITVSGDINISGSYTSGNTSTIFGGNFTNNGTFTNSSIVTFNGTSLQEISLNSGFNSSGTVYFNGTIAPTFAGLTSPTLNNVTINNTGGILAATDWTVGGVFTVNAGASFDGGSRSHTFSGDFMNDGTVSSNGTITFNPSGSVTVKLLGTSFTNNGTTVFGGSGFISITGGTPSLHDVTISNTNVAGVSQTTNWTLSGNVRINNGSTFYGGSALTLTVNQNVLNDGTFEGGTSTVVLNNSIEGNISGSGSSIFNNLTINGVIIAYQDFSVKKDFTNNGTFDGTGINISVIGSGSSIFGGTTTPTPVDHLIIQKTSSTATLAMDINEVTNLHVASGIFDIGSSIITQETVTGGAFQIDSSATAKIGGTNSLPTFNSYSFDTASTVEFNGNGSQTITHTPVYGNLTLSTGGTKSTTGALTMLENFNLSSATFTGGSYTHSLGGNWTMNSGTFTNTGTTINFNGTGTQTINSTGAFNNLTSNKSSGGITLASDVTVNGTLTFTSGNITTGTNKMIVGSTGTVSRTSGYVVGNLQKYISTGSPTMTFEIGDVSNYAPPSLAFSNVTSAGNVIASTTNGDHPQIASSGIDATKSVNRYWSLTNSGTTFTTSDATFNFVSGDVDAGADPNLFFGRIYDGSTWSAPTVGTRTATSTQLTGLTDFGDIQIGEGGNPVPTTTSISPSSKNSGDGAFTLTVNGTNFVAASVVRFNGSDRTTTFVSSSQLTATIPATDLITAGTYPITVFSPTPGGGTSNSQTFTVNSGTLDHFTLSAISSPQVAGIAFAFSMTAKDANNNTVTGFSGTVDISSTGTLITGGGTSASFTSGVLASHAVTISNTGNFTITATKTSGTETGTSNSFTVNPGSSSTVTSTITAAPISITANGTSTSTITVQLKDAYGNNLTTGGETVALSTTSGSLGSVTDNNNGTYTATLTSSTVVGTATITGTLNGSAITDDATVTFTVGSASTATSTITASPTSITANGISTSTITVQLKDVNGNNLTSGGATVALSTTSGSLGSVTDNSNGTYTATLTSSTVVGTATITGTLNGNPIADDATVTFTVGTASTATSTITASPTSITANGISTSTITVQLKDVNGNNLT